MVGAAKVQWMGWGADHILLYFLWDFFLSFFSFSFLVKIHAELLREMMVGFQSYHGQGQDGQPLASVASWAAFSLLSRGEMTELSRLFGGDS